MPRADLPGAEAGEESARSIARTQARGLGLLIRTSWRSDRVRTLAMLVEPAGAIGTFVVGIWLAMITNGVLEHRGGLVVGGLAGLTLVTSGGFLLAGFGNMWRLELAEKVGFEFDREISRLTAALPGLDHFERADYQDRLELLRLQQGVLGGSMNALVNTANALIRAVVVLILLVVVHPILLLLVVVALPSLFVARAHQRWQREAEEASGRPSRLARHLRRMAYDRNAGAEIRVFGLQDELRRRSLEAWDDSQRPLLAAARRTRVAMAARDAGYALAILAAMAFVLWRALNGQASAGDVVLAVYTTQQVQAAVIQPINSVANIGRTLRAAGRMLWLQDYAASAEARRPGDAEPPARIEHEVRFENVSFRYPGSNDWVLRDVSFAIPAGTVLAVVGENGAGKTTLVKLLTRMYDPTEGRILIDGTDLSTLDVARWRERLSAAFQDFARPELVAREVVGIGDLPRIESEHAATSALDRAGAADVVRAMPDGLATRLGTTWDTDGAELSTGQWQKLALGRALMRGTPLAVFFDEPTASLDAPTEHALFARYAQAARSGATHGMVTVLVSHRFSTVRDADLIVVLDGHRVVELGSHADLLAAHGLYAELYTLQARSYA